MKRTVKRLTVLLLIVAVMSAGLVSASAEVDHYTITLYAGNRGTIANGQMTVAPKAVVNLSSLLAGVTVTDSKFYVKGVVRAGYDSSSDGLANMAFEATEDADYTVVYGVKGDMKQYTVQYVSNTGAVLADEEYGYANAGERLIVGCKDIDGYLPNTYNYAMTLSENEAANVFTFIYTLIPAPTPEPNPNPNPNPANGNGDNGTVENATGGENSEVITSEGVTIEAIPQPQELIDLDEEEIPLAQLPEDQQPNSIVTPLLVGAVVAFLGLLVLVLILAKRNKDKKRGYEG